MISIKHLTKDFDDTERIRMCQLFSEVFFLPRRKGGYHMPDSVHRKPVYIAIDLKSYYASVECVQLHQNPLTFNLLVADESRTDNRARTCGPTSLRLLRSTSQWSPHGAAACDAPLLSTPPPRCVPRCGRLAPAPHNHAEQYKKARESECPEEGLDSTSIVRPVIKYARSCVDPNSSSHTYTVI